jgi:hypothetical protein
MTGAVVVILRTHLFVMVNASGSSLDADQSPLMSQNQVTISSATVSLLPTHPSVMVLTNTYIAGEQSTTEVSGLFGVFLPSGVPSLTGNSPSTSENR